MPTVNDVEMLRNALESSNIRHVAIMFTYILGYTRVAYLKSDVFLKEVAEGCRVAKLDGSSVPGFAPVEDSDMYLVPDLSTFRVFRGAVIDRSTRLRRTWSS